MQAVKLYLKENVIGEKPLWGKLVDIRQGPPMELVLELRSGETVTLLVEECKPAVDWERYVGRRFVIYPQWEFVQAEWFFTPIIELFD